MARPKKTNEDLLIAGTKAYFSAFPKKSTAVKYTELAAYISGLYGISLREYEIRRCSKVKELIEELQNQKRKSDIKKAVAFVTLDVEEFLRVNSSYERLKWAITERDRYYEEVSSSAGRIVDENRRLVKQLEMTQCENEMLKKRVEEIEQESINIKKEKNQAKARLKVLVKTMNTYVYPEIANQLLKECGMIISNTEPVIDPEALKNEILREKDSIVEWVEPKEEKTSDKLINQLFYDIPEVQK